MLRAVTRGLMRQWPYERRTAYLEAAYDNNGRTRAAAFAMDLISLSIDDGGITVNDAIRIHSKGVDYGGIQHDREDRARRVTKEEMSKLPYHERLAQGRLLYSHSKDYERAAEIILNMICLKEDEGGIDANDGIEIHKDADVFKAQRYYDQHSTYMEYASHIWQKGQQQ